MNQEYDVVAMIHGYEIRRTVTRIAYARNGNAGNPTKQHGYTVYYNGRPLSSPMVRLKDAREFIQERTASEMEGFDSESYPVKG